MADRENPDKLTVLRSQDLFLVRKGSWGLMVDLVTGQASRVDRVDSLLRMSPVDDPWQAVPFDECPAMVLDAGRTLDERESEGPDEADRVDL